MDLAIRRVKFGTPDVSRWYALGLKGCACDECVSVCIVILLSCKHVCREGGGGEGGRGGEREQEREKEGGRELEGGRLTSQLRIHFNLSSLMKHGTQLILTFASKQQLSMK